jgi:2-polyprenyl-3-methyl-5-hydroxy-6-metoxy-1,4-benzoquinol methylase
LAKDSIGFYPTVYYQIRRSGIWYRDTQRFCNVLWDIYKPVSIADVGCGPGVYLKCFRDLGVKTTLGIEGSESAIKLALTKNIIKHDLRLPFSTTKLFSLVLCIEVAEHLDESSSNVLLQTIANLCDHGSHLIFTAARPGQLGLHHLNLQPRSYWIEKLQNLGFELSEKDTAKIVRLFQPKFMLWVKKNLMCFHFLGNMSYNLPIVTKIRFKPIE